MPNRVNRNIEFLTDDEGNLVGYQKKPGSDVGILTVDANSGVINAGAADADGYQPVSNPVMRVRVTGPSTATFTGKDKFGAEVALGSVSGNSSDVLYAEECIKYKVTASAGTTVEVF